MRFSLMSRDGVDGNAPYQAQELQITILGYKQTSYILGWFYPNATKQL